MHPVHDADSGKKQSLVRYGGNHYLLSDLVKAISKVKNLREKCKRLVEWKRSYRRILRLLNLVEEDEQIFEIAEQLVNDIVKKGSKFDHGYFRHEGRMFYGPALIAPVTATDELITTTTAAWKEVKRIADAIITPTAAYNEDPEEMLRGIIAEQRCQAAKLMRIIPESATRPDLRFTEGVGGDCRT